MLPTTSLMIAKTGIQEIRLLLQGGRAQVAREVAEAMINLPVDEHNAAQAKDVEQKLSAYFESHPERAALSHWQSLFSIEDTSSDSPLDRDHQHAQRDA